LSERETSELREQFIAVLGHDLRNPLASIAAGTKMLTKEDSKEAAGEILGLMQKSVARMSALIDNVLDFARGRLGGGITLKRLPQSLEPVLKHVIAELRASSPERKIEARFDLTQQVDCDGGRIGQLFSNLLGNSVAHGTAASPIRVRATTQDGEDCRSPIRATRSHPKRWTACFSLSTAFPRGTPGKAWDWGYTSPPKSHVPMVERLA
jgi:signal transduction histidine kinase